MKQQVVIITAIIAFVAGVIGAVLGRGHLSFISADVTSIANDLGQERSKNITLNYELETVTNRLNQSTSQLREKSSQLLDAQGKIGQFSVDLSHSEDQLREKSSQLLKTQGQIATLSDRAETAESRVRILESSDLNQLSAQLVEAQGQIKQLTARAEKAESRVKTLEPKQPTGPSLKDRWKTVLNLKGNVSSSKEAVIRMGQPPTLVIQGAGFYQSPSFEWDQYDWEAKIFPHYKVDRTTWPTELNEIRPQTEQMSKTGQMTDRFVLLIWVLDDDSIGAWCGCIQYKNGVSYGGGYYKSDGECYAGQRALTLPRSALPRLP